jgi:hypothetical protein
MPQGGKDLETLESLANAAPATVKEKFEKYEARPPRKKIVLDPEELRQKVTKAFACSFIALIFLCFFVIVGSRYLAFIDNSSHDQMLKDVFAIIQVHLAVLNLVLGYYFGSREKEREKES